MTDAIAEKLALLPDLPGVYIMKDADGKIIYVGKAIILKNRVRQYFRQNKNHSPKVTAMVEKIADFETIITATEVEALILECNLIKKHRPRYNISLKDDKSYPYVKAVLAEEYPRVFLTRRIVKDGSRYFGPYPSVTAVTESLKLIRKLFPIRTCRQMQSRPCLNYHIKRCCAPCGGKISKEEYDAMIKSVCLFLEGRTDDVAKDLQKRMEAAAAEFSFETAARLRDQLMAVQKVAEKQKIVTDAADRDAIALARGESGVSVEIFFVRGGKLLGREHFLIDGGEEETDEAITAAFIKQYYHRATFVPKELLLPFPLTEEEVIAEWLSAKKGAKVAVFAPQRGTKRDLVQMAKENAEKFLADEAARIEKKFAAELGAVQELGEYLHLKNPPRRMECFDISHNQGQETVASMVVFENGAPKKSAYRRYKIRSAEGKPDDFKSMREVTKRRYEKLSADAMPDLIVIDGGMGQLSSALAVIRGAGHFDVPVVGLAKQHELIFVEGSSVPIELPRQSRALYLIERLRDEAHRFAITYHRKLRQKRNLVSMLDNISGIGKKRRSALMNHFGGIAGIKAASVEELAAAPSMNMAAAESVHNFFLLLAAGRK